MKNWVIEGKLKTFILLKILQKENISSFPPIQIKEGDFIPHFIFDQEERVIFVNSIEVRYFNFKLSNRMIVGQDGTNIFIIYSTNTTDYVTRILAIFSIGKLIYLADRYDYIKLIRQHHFSSVGYSIYNKEKYGSKTSSLVLNTITEEWTIEAQNIALTQGGVGVLVETDEKFKVWNDILDPLTGKSILANLEGKRSIHYIYNSYYAIFLKGVGTYSLFNSKTGHEIKLGLKIDWNNPDRFKIDKIKGQDFLFMKTKDDETWRIFDPITERFIESI